ncbi:hypothetical protein CJD36_010985 [Flavipsychrobacter stenotrophus]|uniref:RHS repeat-associated core domain-containing protein n=1 Tax=Flavipsychrobacter stenotrophus TaxID=2077091 RepID=A0A2S7SUB3_9BACT|nr:AHH domain-containing protein [Flavipsychrobacter stenotrophus]PQJ10493.1 hypothetical protein CJD36_010985 [Flavipsychrobacter stenotrophus]
MNNDSLNVGLDMAQDGTDTSVFARDAVAYAIDYFKNDYKPVSHNSLQHTTPVTHSLYNGNIARQTMAINEFQRLNKQYAYDQLNRIRNAGYSTVNAADHSLSGIADYKNDYTYDADGNLRSLNRYGNNTGAGAPLMDSLVYRYTPGAIDNKLQSVLDHSADVTDNALTPFNDTSGPRYMYDRIGNTVKDLVSGQDTVRWNLYNKVTSTQNNAGGNTMQFRYDGAGNRVAKYFSTGSDTGTNQTNNYYVHDAQGNILATYNEKTRFTMEPITFIHLAHRGMRSTVGGDENFNNLFITPEFAGVAEFQDMLLNRSADNGDFIRQQTDHPVSYFLNSTGRLKDFIYSDPSYLPALVASDIKAEQPILAPAINNYFKNGGEDDVRTVLSLVFSDPGLQQHALGLLCAAHNGDSTLWLIHKRYSSEVGLATQQAQQQHLLDSAASSGDTASYQNTTGHSDTTGGGGYNPADSTGGYSDSTHLDSAVVLNCDTLLQHINDDRIEQSILVKLAMDYAVEMGAMEDWLRLICTDSLLYGDDGRGGGSSGGDTIKIIAVDRSDGLKPMPDKGGSGTGLTKLVMASLANYEDGYGSLLSFFDSWVGAARTMEALFTTGEKLRAVFNNDPAAYVNAFNAAFGDDEIDSAVAALPRLSLLTHLSTATADLGVGLPPTLATVAVVKEKQFDLASHDIYGSSRLGVKSYYPHQVSVSYTQDGGFTDTNRLWTKRPWYSLEYQDIITQDSLNFYGNAHKDVYYTQHTRGLKQYELTDHLGDVLVTLSDKRAMNRWLALPAAVDSILSYKPVVVTAYDYYPFGQYMPGRYTEDTTSYCFTTTLTEMITVVTMVLLDLGHPRMMNSGGSGPSVTPSDNGGILIHMDGAGAGTGTGVSWPMGDGGGDPTGSTGNPADGDVLVTATVRDGVFNVSVVDDSTGKNLGNVVISSGDNNGIIKIHYSGGGHGASLHVTLDNAGNDNNISISAIRVPHYTYVPQSVVSRVCNGESYRYGYNGQMKNNEWAGLGNHLDFKFRGYDPGVARFSAVDPLFKKYPWNSNYAFAENRVIDGKDLEGREWLSPLLFETIKPIPNIEIVPAEEVIDAVGDAVEMGIKMNDHHVNPAQLKQNPVMQAARRAGFKFEGKENKVPLEQFSKETGKGQHGNHPNYNEQVKNQYDQFEEGNPSYSDEEALNFIRNTTSKNIETIKKNPGVKLNKLDLFRGVPTIDNLNARRPIDETKIKPQKIIRSQWVS